MPRARAINPAGLEQDKKSSLSMALSTTGQADRGKPRPEAHDTSADDSPGGADPSLPKTERHPTNAAKKQRPMLKRLTVRWLRIPKRGNPLSEAPSVNGAPAGAKTRPARAKSRSANRREPEPVRHLLNLGHPPVLRSIAEPVEYSQYTMPQHSEANCLKHLKGIFVFLMEITHDIPF